MYRNKKGFSLLEIFIVLLIIAILSAMAVSSYQTFLASNQQQVVKSQLLRAMQLTRMEAIANRSMATLCKSENQKTCGGTWQDGYIIFSAGKVSYIFHHPDNKGVLHWRAPLRFTGLQFFPSGFPRVNGTFWYCPDKSTKPAWAIVMNKAGRIRQVAAEKIDETFPKDKKLRC